MNLRPLLLGLLLCSLLPGCPTETDPFSTDDDDDDDDSVEEGFAIANLSADWEQLGGAIGWTVRVDLDINDPPEPVGDSSLFARVGSRAPLELDGGQLRPDLMSGGNPWSVNIGGVGDPSTVEVEVWLVSGGEESNHLQVVASP